MDVFFIATLQQITYLVRQRKQNEKAVEYLRR